MGRLIVEMKIRNNSIAGVLFAIVLLAVTGGLGFGFGRNFQSDVQSGASIVVAQTLDEPNSNKINYNRTIAIVNLDEGIVRDEGTINYGNILISELSSDVRVTGLQDARNGIENGQYSGYLIVPTSFSENIMTINEKPVTSELSYAIAPELAGEERDAAIYNVYAIYNSFSDNITQMYTATILEEYHNAQDSASTIMANDTKDLNTLLGIQVYDLVENVPIPDMQQSQLELTHLLLDENYVINNNKIKELDAAYQKYFENATTDYAMIVESISDVNGQIEATGKSLGETASELEAYIKEYKEKWDIGFPDSIDETDVVNLGEKLRNDDAQIVAEFVDFIQTIDADINNYNNLLQQYNASVAEKTAYFEYLENEYRTVMEQLQELSIVGESVTVEWQEEEMDVNEYSCELYTLEQMEQYQSLALDKVRENIVSEMTRRDWYLVEGDQIVWDRYGMTPEQCVSNLMGIGEHQQEQDSYSGDAGDVSSGDGGHASIGDAGDEASNDSGSESSGDIEIPYDDDYPYCDIDISEVGSPVRFLLHFFEDLIGTPLVIDDEEVEHTNMDPVALDAIDEKLNDLVITAQAAMSKKNDDMVEGFGQMNQTYHLLKNLQVQSGFLQTAKGDLVSKSQKYNLHSYIDNLEITSVFNAMNDNIRTIEEKAKTFELDQNTSIETAYRVADENVALLKDSIYAGQNASEEKLSAGLETAKKSRSESNAQNVALLKTLTSRLPYTRLGNVENKEVYTFMAKPVTLYNKSETILSEAPQPIATTIASTGGVKAQNSGNAWTLYAICGLTGLGVIGTVVRVILKSGKKPEEF